ncbi:MAG: AmmeMemoRadiSam system radical SAM enzyme [Planctomycetes bacterium RBG_13_63_9]|nr:MAG: AmmeMemoRadiSam system radical SAM enzyme [Planctomycetes bacterium RBG_13_63_9]
MVGRQAPARPRKTSRRQVLKYGASGLACLSLGGAGAYYFCGLAESAAAASVFKNDAPKGPLWRRWQDRGWAKEARHYITLGRNIQCELCPNECVLEPEDRGRCRNRVHKDGKLYTLAYGNPCAVHIDRIEKKPLFHFLPDTGIFSIATSGCGFRCLNCQNWDISQRKPEETKDPRGDSIRLAPRGLGSLGRDDFDRMSVFPEDVVALAEYTGCPSIAYTYSEPTVWYEYMYDTAKAARQKGIKNVWVTCGYIRHEPLVELCGVLDAANVDLKSYDEEIYRRLNSGKLEPILQTLKTLKQQGVWFEVTNLVVPTYTDKPEMIRRMCDWLVENLGPDYPLHFSRFHPEHKLTHLPPTPAEMLDEARSIARDAGLHYVYVGNCRDVKDPETTFCPGCEKPVVRRTIYTVGTVDVKDGKCTHCDTEIAGVWDMPAS